MKGSFEREGYSLREKNVIEYYAYFLNIICIKELLLLLL